MKYIDVEGIENQIKGTMAVEGIKPSKEGEKITNSFLKGEISSEEALRKIKKYWGVK